MMKCIFLWLTLSLLIFSWGCEGDPGYVGNTIDQKRESQKQILLIQGRKILDLYRAEHQKWPNTLDEVEMPPLPSPWAWVYSNKNGMLTIGETND